MVEGGLGLRTTTIIMKHLSPAVPHLPTLTLTWLLQIAMMGLHERLYVTGDLVLFFLFNTLAERGWEGERSNVQRAERAIAIGASRRERSERELAEASGCVLAIVDQPHHTHAHAHTHTHIKHIYKPTRCKTAIATLEARDLS